MRERLRQGVFAPPYCEVCRRWVWPPSEWCNTCHGMVRARPYSERGSILVCSSRCGVVFCMCEFPGGIRMMGRLVSGPRRAGSTVVLHRCGLSEDRPFFEFTSTTSH